MTYPEPSPSLAGRAWAWFKGTEMPFWTKRVLSRPGEPAYMVRYHLFVTRWLTIYLNKILTRDYDKRLHSHPWKRSYSLKLRGRYIEQVAGPRPYQVPERWSRIPKEHRIVYLFGGGPVWTLFIALGSKRPWGFRNADGSVEYRA